MQERGKYIHRPQLHFPIFVMQLWKRCSYLRKHCAVTLRREQRRRCFMIRDTRGLTIGIGSRFNALVCPRVFVIDDVASVSQEWFVACCFRGPFAVPIDKQTRFGDTLVARMRVAKRATAWNSRATVVFKWNISGGFLNCTDGQNP